MRRTKAPLPSNSRNPFMLALAIVTIICFTISWFFFAIVAYAVIYGALIFSYIFLWDDHMRQATCPKGLWHTILYDE